MRLMAPVCATRIRTAYLRPCPLPVCYGSCHVIIAHCPTACDDQLCSNNQQFVPKYTVIKHLKSNSAISSEAEQVHSEIPTSELPSVLSHRLCHFHDVGVLPLLANWERVKCAPWSRSRHHLYLRHRRRQIIPLVHPRRQPARALPSSLLFFGGINATVMYQVC